MRVVPTTDQIQLLWETYHLPARKRAHVALVARVAIFLARQLSKRDSSIQIDEALLSAAALLHDVDKAAPKRPGEQHPDAGERILLEKGYPEVAQLVRTHPLHAILDPRIAPSTIEEKLLYLSDKMVKDEIITVDKRFALWRAEGLPGPEVRVLDESYPLVKQLETEIFQRIGLRPEDVAKLAI